MKLSRLLLSLFIIAPMLGLVPGSVSAAPRPHASPAKSRDLLWSADGPGSTLVTQPDQGNHAQTVPEELALPTAADILQSRDFGPSDDAYVDSRDDTTHGYKPYMLVGRQQSPIGVQASLLRFDLSDLPDDAVIDEAILHVFVESGTGAETVTIDLHPLEGEWNEKSVTFSDAPDVGPVYATAMDVGDLGWTEWDVTQLVQEWVSGKRDNHGVGLAGPVKGEYTRQLASKESANEKHHPTLRISYTAPPNIISGPEVIGTTDHSATIVWETDQLADSVVRYGSRSGTYDLEVEDPNLVTAHHVVLTDLTPATVYHFVVQSTGAAGHTVVSGEHFFTTHPDPYADQPPSVDSLTFSKLEGPFDFYRMTATVSDDVGLDRVEFYFGDELVGTDYRRLDAGKRDYHAYVDPVSLGISREDFLGEHDLRAVATNRYGQVGDFVLPDTVPMIDPLDGLLDIVEPPPDHTVYVEGSTVPPDTILPVRIRASQYDFRCTWQRDWPTEREPVFAHPQPAVTESVSAPAQHTGYLGAPPMGEIMCEDVQRPVSKLVISIDGTPVHTATPPSAVYVDYAWNIGGYAVGGEHHVSVMAWDADGGTAHRQHAISIEGEGIDVERSVVRKGNYFEFGFTVTNVGSLPVELDQIQDNLTSFQAVAAEEQHYEVRTNYTLDNQECRVILDFFGDSRSSITLDPGQSITAEYLAVPTWQAAYRHGVRIGAWPVRVRYRGHEGLVVKPFWLGVNPFEPPVDVGAARNAADYLIVTNPERLLDHNWWEDDVQNLLSAMAELSVLKNGVLGYLSVPTGIDADFDPSSPQHVRSKIMSWGRDMRGSTGVPGGYLSNAHLLLVGEAEIVPAWEVLIERWYASDTTVGWSDLPYANTAGSHFYPELMVSRIIGNDAENLLVPIETSLNVHRGTSDHGFDRSDALVLAGGGGGARSFENNAEGIAELLEDEFSVLTLKQRDVEDDGGDMNAQVRANIADRDVICYRGHGWERSWSAGDVLSTDDFGWLDPVDFGTTNPFAFALACGAGGYAGVTGIAESFLGHGAGLYIGSTEVSLRHKNNEAGTWFYANWVNASDSVAYVFRDLKHNLGSWYADRMWRAEYNLYGDAKFDVLPTTVSASLPMQVAAQPSTTLEISIPDYEISTIADEHHVTLPGGNLLTEEIGRPLVPFKTLVVDYPAGTQVQSVTMAERTDLSTATGLQLPTVTLEWDAAGTAPAAVPQTTGWWPARDFDWHVQPGPLGTSTLHLHVYPFYYNPQTTDVHFYQDYTFDVQIITSTVEIVSLETDKHVYPQGDQVGIALWLENTGDPQDAILDAAIVHESSGEVVGGLSLESLGGLVGLASFHTTWDTTGVEPGQYAVDLRIRDGSGNVLQRGMASFQLGIHAGEITSLTATPDSFTIGDAVDVSMAFRNVGTVPITGTAFIQIEPASGLTTTALFTQTMANLAPSSSAVLDGAWDTSGAEKGTYRVLGHVLYHSTSTDPVSIQVSTLPELYLPLVVRNH